MIDANPLLNKLHWKVDVNPAVGFLINTDSANAYCPVNLIYCCNLARRQGKQTTFSEDRSSMVIADIQSNLGLSGVGSHD